VEERKSASKIEQEEQEANLYEQLFGPLNPDKEQRRVPEKEVPPIPLENPSPLETPWQRSQPWLHAGRKSKYQRQLESEHFLDDTGISVLVLRNASKNLVEEDFRRLIPQGSHLEGWTLEQGDIVKVIAGRDLTTLEQKNFYYLLFSSALSAFAYQGHATRVHKIVASHTPSSILSPMMPPPGIMSKNMDANTAIQSFSLVAPNHELDLRQLKPPLTPMMQAIARNRGYPHLVSRKDRMPYEARLTLEGPQLHERALRHFFRLDGIDRQLSWSGNDSVTPVVTKWVPPQTATMNGRPSPMRKGREADEWGRRQENAEQEESERGQARILHEKAKSNIADAAEVDAAEFSDGWAGHSEKEGWVKPRDAFIIGFATERAMQSFVQHWHRRPMQMEKFEHDTKSDVPPIINVEALW
jgi:hypothetical protein